MDYTLILIFFNILNIVEQNRLKSQKKSKNNIYKFFYLTFIFMYFAYLKKNNV